MKKLSAVFTVIVVVAGMPVVSWAQAGGVKPFLGKWQLILQYNNRPVESTLTIKQKKDGSLTGTWQSRRGLTYVKNVKVKDGVLSFSPIYKTKSGEVLLVSRAQIKDGTLVGKMIWPSQGDFSFTGTRPKPGTVTPKPTTPTGVRGPGGMFERLDASSDGLIQVEELPDRMKPYFATIDLNGDGGLDKSELDTMVWSRRRRSN